MKRIANIFTPNRRHDEEPARANREQGGSAQNAALAGPASQNGQREQPLSQVPAAAPGAVANQNTLLRRVRQFDLRGQNRAAARNQEDALQRLRTINPRLTISDLRIGDESGIDLLTIPAEDEAGPVRETVDPASARLTGRAYLEFLKNDVRLGRFTRLFVNSRNILRNPDISDAHLARVAERLRPVMARAYTDEAFKDKVDGICLESANLCGDRTDHSIGEMQHAALLLSVENDELDEADLYNCGIGFYKLDEVHRAVAARLPLAPLEQGVHDYLNAEYCLQDEFKLPVQHERPIYLDHNVSVITPQIAREIAAEVRTKIPAGDYERAFAFMGAWAPWVEHTKSQESLGQRFEAIGENFLELMDQLETERENPTIQMTDAQYVNEANQIMHARTEWEAVVIGQYAKEFLMNARATAKLDAQDMPEFFATVQ